MLRAEKKSSGVIYAVIFTVVVISLSVHLTAYVYSHAGPLSLQGYLALSVGIACLLAPACSFFLGNYTARIFDLKKKVTARIMKDPLTGSLNREAFMESIANEQARMHRTRAPAAVLLLDLDHFRILNNRYGHDAGDLVLQNIADTLKSDLRTGTDFMTRWGGEEFAIVLAETKIDEAMIVAERMRARIETLRTQHKDEAIKTTVSIGVTDLHWAECLKQAIDRADNCVFKAKGDGRNYVVRSEATQPPFLMAEHRRG